MMSRFGLGLLGEEPLSSTIASSVLAEEKGFHSVWIAEDYYLRDAFTSIAALAATTRKIKLATGVINPYTRSPALTAMSLATVDELSGNRVILGLGSSLKVWIEEQMGIPMGNRLSALREYVQSVRALLRGEKVTLEGAYFKLRDIALTSVPASPHLPIYLAAVGPKMLQLASEISDGVLFTAGNSPAYVRYAVKLLEDGAKKANRDHSKFDVASYIFYSEDENGDRARNASRNLVGYVLSPLEYGNLMCEISGFEPSVLDRIREAIKSGSISELSRLVSDDMVDAFSVSGTPKECKQKLGKYLDAGVTLPVIMPVGKNVNETIESAATIFR